MCPTVGQLDVYIPRVHRSRVSFPFIASVFAENKIGYVEHIDFVEINANHGTATEPGVEPEFVKHPHIVSAFVKVSFWDLKTLDAIRNPPNLRKLYLYSDSDEHWLLLPNKTPIDRTILNIHQVAYYTAELQTKVSDLTKAVEDITKQNQELAKMVEMLIKRDGDRQAEMDALKAQTQTQRQPNVSIVYNAHTEASRKLTSDCLCGNA
jgi:hypothetical protein